jgi:hypothetical protein
MPDMAGQGIARIAAVGMAIPGSWQSEMSRKARRNEKDLKV